MSILKKVNKTLLLFVFCGLFNSMEAQFENMGMRITSSEMETDMINDSNNNYLRLMLCGDIIHNKELFNKYSTRDEYRNISYRQWFRQIKPFFFFSDFVVANLKTNFPDFSPLSKLEYSAPDEFLGELSYSGFNILMMANNRATSLNDNHNFKTLNKLDLIGFYRAGLYYNDIDKKKNFPLVLEKKDIRIGFLNYTMDSAFYDFGEENVNFFRIDSVRKDIQRAKDMLVDYLILYMDWKDIPDSMKLSLNVELVNLGVDVIVGTGQKGFTTADLLNFSGGSKKIIVNNIGAINSDSNSRETNKSAIVEIILKKHKRSNLVKLHDMGFIPLWTVKDNERFAVVPINNIEEKHIKNVGVNYIQYSNMKVALTDLRFAFFDKLPELHYDFTDEIVTNVEQTAYIRKTIVQEQQKLNENMIEKNLQQYVATFGQLPPTDKRYFIPYEDQLKIYAPVKKKVATDPLDPKHLKIDTTDQVAENGILNVRANKTFYTREKDTTTPLTKEEIRKRDSIKKYEERFYVKDTLAEYKAKLKRIKAEQKRIKDSIYKASIDPNYISKTVPVFEPKGAEIDYKKREEEKTGVFTTTATINVPKESSKKAEFQPEIEEKSPVKEIEEYFMVQVYSMKKNTAINLDKLPFLAGYEVRFEEGNYRYYIGRTRSPLLAIEMCKSIISKGISDAMVVKYTDGKRSIYKSDF
jgi:hypothetical protein